MAAILAKLVAGFSALVLVLAGIAAAVAQSQTIEARLLKPYPRELREVTGKPGTIESEPLSFVVFDREAIVRVAGVTYLDSTRGYLLQRQTAFFVLSRTAAGAAVGLALGVLLLRFGGRQGPPGNK